MKCPNCNEAELKTIETRQDVERTYRNKRCQKCLWTFTSVEEIPDDVPVIPTRVRKRKQNEKLL